MKKLILFLFCVVLVLSGCSNTQIQNSVNNVEDEKEEIVYTSKIKKSECALCSKGGKTLLPAYAGQNNVGIAYVQHRVPMDKKSRINKYTPEGRLEIHKNLAGINMAVLYYLMNNPCGKQSVEYNDNRIALYVAQKGKCAVSGVELEAKQVDCHHKKPLVLGGNDSYQNLIIVSAVVHILIHSSNERTLRKDLKVLNLDKKQLAKLNKLRVMAEMLELVF